MIEFFLVLYLELDFLSAAYLTVAKFLVRSQCLVRLFSLCWITGDHTIHAPFERLLPLTDIGSTPFRNSASKVAGIQMHAITLGQNNYYSILEDD